MHISVQVSAGELVDRITILEIKLSRLPRAVHAELVRELAEARAVQRGTLGVSPAVERLTKHLHAVNLELWELEEELRECERVRSFGARFIELARAVYKTNDLRAALKSRIDSLVGSRVREHKSYALPRV